MYELPNHLVQADSAASWFFRSLGKALYWITPTDICLETKCFLAAHATRYRSEVKIRIEDLLLLQDLRLLSVKLRNNTCISTIFFF